MSISHTCEVYRYARHWCNDNTDYHIAINAYRFRARDKKEVKCLAFDMKMIFLSHANKTDFRRKCCALGLILKVRIFGTRNQTSVKCPRVAPGLGKCPALRMVTKEQKPPSRATKTRTDPHNSRWKGRRWVGTH